jgi:hypothetical protein
MGFATETSHIPDHLMETSVAAFGSMVEILDALENQDALSIFIYVEKGMTNSKLAIRKLGLTQKSFYSRLKELIGEALRGIVVSGDHGDPHDDGFPRLGQPRQV